MQVGCHLGRQQQELLLIPLSSSLLLLLSLSVSAASLLHNHLSSPPLLSPAAADSPLSPESEKKNPDKCHQTQSPATLGLPDQLCIPLCIDWSAVDPHWAVVVLYWAGSVLGWRQGATPAPQA